MRTFLMCSTEYAGEIEYRYNEGGYLVYYENRTDLPDDRLVKALKMLPATVAMLQDIDENYSGVSVREYNAEISFDMFWERWFRSRKSDNSNKKRALVKWAQMSASERLKAFNHIPKYYWRINTGTAPMHANTYLNSDLWNN